MSIWILAILVIGLTAAGRLAAGRHPRVHRVRRHFGRHAAMRAGRKIVSFVAAGAGLQKSAGGVGAVADVRVHRGLDHFFDRRVQCAPEGGCVLPAQGGRPAAGVVVAVEFAAGDLRGDFEWRDLFHPHQLPCFQPDVPDGAGFGEREAAVHHAAPGEQPRRGIAKQRAGPHGGGGGDAGPDVLQVRGPDGLPDAESADGTAAGGLSGR